MRLFICLLAFLGSFPVALSAAEVTGKARVTDGDSLRVAGHRIRLFGIDAPEADQTCISPAGVTWNCGTEAARVLQDRIRGQRITCALRGKDDWGRDLAICYLDGRNLNAWLVEEGWAFAFRRYSMMFDLEEKSAAVNNRGLHGHVFDRPTAFRQAKRAQAVAEAPPPPAGECRIKGNISSSGRIYHMPGQRDYDQTRIAERKGERWFCSEAEARAAGWRAARR